MLTFENISKLVICGAFFFLSTYIDFWYVCWQTNIAIPELAIKDFQKCMKGDLGHWMFRQFDRKKCRATSC